jgi:hypothetical protein
MLSTYYTRLNNDLKKLEAAKVVDVALNEAEVLATGEPTKV